MPRESVEERHARNLEVLTGNLGITTEKYFELIHHPVFWNEFREIIEESLRAEMTLWKYWTSIVENHEDDAFRSELYLLMGPKDKKESF